MTPSPMEERVRKRSSADFVFGKVIGEGSFSTVYLAKDIHTQKEFAIKVLDKRHIIREKKSEYVTREKKVLQILSGTTDYFVRLYCTFQDPERLYFVLTYAKNGELLSYINKPDSFSLEASIYYSAELVLALEVLHSKGIIHRDLKPENILIDENWHIVITDFGSAKITLQPEETSNEESERKRRNSFVGTAQYVSPELLTDSNASYASDLWALGCIIYQMVCGLMPFRAGSEYLIFQKILKLDYEFPEGFNKSAKDLVEKLLVIEGKKRLGALDETPYTSIREHEFFKDVNFDSLGDPPKISKNEEEEEHTIPDHLEPGLDEEKESKLHLEDFVKKATTVVPQTTPKKMDKKNIADVDAAELERRLEDQKNDKYHSFVEGNLILKKGLIDKRKGLFPRRRMFLLTLGPHIYYVDPTNMVLKGEIPWSADIRTEAKNFKTFFVHTPNRTYFLEDPEGYALEWCKAIDEVKAFYYPEKASTS